LVETPTETTTETPAEAPADPKTELREQAVDALARLQAELGDAIVEHGGSYGDVVVRVGREAWRTAAQVCKEKLGCDYLSFIAGIDWMPTPAVTEDGSGDTSTPAQPKEQTYGVAGSEGRYQLFAVVMSTRRKSWRVILKTDLPDDDLHVQSWVPVYAGADWHEREAWEMYGFVFDGHPSLRHLYLPSEFEGHPLRKDYPLLAREVKPWPGLVDVEPMPGEAADDEVAPAIDGGESA
jgi:NADH-quinone oxidoreductase subunit C